MTDIEQQTKKLGCCGRLLAEWRLSMFSTTDANGKTIDLEATFHLRTRPAWIVYIIIKICFLVWAISAVISEIIGIDEPGFWFAYLTHWGSLSTILYFALSLSCAIRPISQQPVNFLTRSTWFMFTTTVCIEILITLLYWGLEYKPGKTITYESIMQHGVFMVIIMLDGFVLSRIPVRFKQIIGFLVFEVAFIVWSGIHAASGIGNPNRSDGDPNTDDDSIYGAVSWNQRPQAGIIVAIGAVFVGCPLIFLVVWSLSTCGRHYLTYSQEGDQQPDKEDVEVGQSGGNSDSTDN